jgi:hypothetical protein
VYAPDTYGRIPRQVKSWAKVQANVFHLMFCQGQACLKVGVVRISSCDCNIHSGPWLSWLCSRCIRVQKAAVMCLCKEDFDYASESRACVHAFWRIMQRHAHAERNCVFCLSVPVLPRERHLTFVVSRARHFAPLESVLLHYVCIQGIIC